MSFLDELWADIPPEERQRLLDEAKAEWDNAIQYRCIHDNCTWYYDEANATVIGGMGLAGCPCEDQAEIDPHAMLATRISDV